MCVSLPAQVLSLENDTAIVTTGASQIEVGRKLVPEAGPGDWVLVNAGQMVSLILAEEADAIRELLREVMLQELEETAGHNRAQDEESP